MSSNGSSEARESPKTIDHLERWRQGDESAFSSLYERLTPLLRQRALNSDGWSALQTRVQIDDVIQEFWTRSFRAAKDSFEDLGRGSLLGYLGTLLDRQLVSMLRHENAKKRGAGRVRKLETSFDTPDGPNTPTSQVRLGELQQIARATLSDREYQAWDFVERQGYASAEAGFALDCSDSAVRSVLRRAKAKLVARLSRGGAGDAAGESAAQLDEGH